MLKQLQPSISGIIRFKHEPHRPGTGLVGPGERRSAMLEEFGLIAGAFSRSLEQGPALHRIIIGQFRIRLDTGFVSSLRGKFTAGASAITRKCQQSLKTDSRNVCILIVCGQ